MIDVTIEQETCPEVSVVVPVYNKAPYLAACLESVLAQTLPSLELICVDDGSTDGSREILDRFAERDPRVKVICHGRNRGAAAARNVGLDAANGEFVQFTDADDLLDPDALRLLISAARADTVPIVRGGIVGFRSATPEKQLDLDIPEARSGVRPLEDESTWSPWWHTTYLFSRRLLVSEGIRYPDLCSGEDPVFLARVLSRAPAVSTLATVVYRHRLMPLGKKGRTTYRHLRDYLRHAEMTRDLFLESNGEAWHRGFAPSLLPEIRSMIDGWQMSDHERAAATAEMQRIFELPRPLAKAARRKVLFMYRVCGLGGVETSIVNKLEALSARGIEVRAVFQSSWGEGGQVLARHPGFAIAADEEAQKRLILDWAPDVIAVVDTPRFVNVIRKAGVRCSVLFETHMSDIEAFKKRRILDGISSSHVSKVVVPSAFNRDTLAAQGVDPQRVRVIANAIDTRQFSAKSQSDIRRRLGLPEDRRLVLFVGRLEPQKNPLEFVRVCATLLDRGMDIHAVIVGDAIDTVDFSGTVRAEAAALHGHITFIPRVPYEEMPSIYAAVALSGGCLVSTSLHESQPMILLEAMACACPVVASDVGGVREIVRDGATGHCYPLGDASKAAAAALLLMDDKDHRAAMVEAALRHVEERHSPASTAEAYIALLDEVGAAGQREASPQPALS